jgi:hypothetical protein
MHCPSCGLDNPALSLFCRNCLNELYDPALHEHYERVNIDRLIGICRGVYAGIVEMTIFQAVQEEISYIVFNSLNSLEELQISENDADAVSVQQKALYEGLTMFSQGIERLASSGVLREKSSVTEALSLVEAGNHRLNDGISIIAGELETEQQSMAVFGSAWLDAAGRHIGQ